MKKSFVAKQGLFVLFILNAITISNVFGQCVNSGIGVDPLSATSKLHIKGCGSNSSTSSLHVMNLAGNPLLFINDGGGIGVGTSTPVTMLHLNWNGYGAMYFGNNDVNGHIITHEPSDNSLVFWSGTYGVGSTMRLKLDAQGRLGIGAPAASRLDVLEPTPVGGTANNSQLLTTARGVTGTSTYNEFKHNLWLRRKTTGTDWTTVVSHDGISVDASYLTPGTNTRTWWERDPWNNLQSWGTQASTFMTLEGNGRFGIGTTTPTYRFHVAGASTNGEMATFQNGTQETYILTKALSQSYNQIVAANDNGIFWRDNMATPNPTSGFVIAPWSDASPVTPGGLRGIRIDGPTGNLGVGIAAPFYKIEASGDIFANQGTLMASKNGPEGGGLMLFNLTKTAAAQNVYKLWNMTGGYGNKFSIWGYSANGSLLPAERFSIWDNGDFSFHGTTSVSMVKFAANGNVGIGAGLTTVSEALQINTTIAIHDGGDKVLAYGWAPSTSTDWDATKFAGELRYNPVIGAISLGTSPTVTTLPTPRFFIDKNGSTGLGTVLPSTLLHLKDGHIRSEQTTLPTVTAIPAPSQFGITSATLSAGSSDTKGTINATGDNNAGGNTVITINFNKVYTVAPVVVITPTNLPGQGYTFYATAGLSSFTLNLKDAGTNVNPSFNYIVIE